MTYIQSSFLGILRLQGSLSLTPADQDVKWLYNLKQNTKILVQSCMIPPWITDGNEEYRLQGIKVKVNQAVVLDMNVTSSRGLSGFNRPVYQNQYCATLFTLFLTFAQTDLKFLCNDKLLVLKKQKKKFYAS